MNDTRCASRGFGQHNHDATYLEYTRQSGQDYWHVARKGPLLLLWPPFACVREGWEERVVVLLLMSRAHARSKIYRQ